MKFRDFLLTETKYHNGVSMRCGKCSSYLLVWDVKANLKHIYPVGQLFRCLKCKDTALWTNSIRDPGAFFDWLDGKAENYTAGFCNDAFCGLCFGWIMPLKNGYEFEGKRCDLYGCQRCPQNQKIVVDGYLKDREGDTKRIEGWYKMHRQETEKVAAWVNEKEPV